jgi:hypothetical protein
MDNLDRKAIERLRERYRRQGSVSEVLREITRLLPSQPYHKLDLLANIRAVFALSLGEASPICGWSPDGSGELKDAQIDGFLIPAIEGKRNQWDFPQNTNA